MIEPRLEPGDTTFVVVEAHLAECGAVPRVVGLFFLGEHDEGSIDEAAVAIFEKASNRRGAKARRFRDHETRPVRDLLDDVAFVEEKAVAIGHGRGRHFGG